MVQGTLAGHVDSLAVIVSEAVLGGLVLGRMHLVVVLDQRRARRYA